LVYRFKKEDVIDTIEKTKSLQPDLFYSYAHVPWIKETDNEVLKMRIPKDS
jgi:oxygen-independent coproporphyrinogen-3 oxidase